MEELITTLETTYIKERNSDEEFRYLKEKLIDLKYKNLVNFAEMYNLFKIYLKLFHTIKLNEYYFEYQIENILFYIDRFNEIFEYSNYDTFNEISEHYDCETFNEDTEKFYAYKVLSSVYLLLISSNNMEKTGTYVDYIEEDLDDLLQK